MRRRSAFLTVLLALGFPALARADVTDRAAFGTNRIGVTLQRSHGEYVFRFAARARPWLRKLAGRSVRIRCERLATVSGGAIPRTTRRVTVRAPRHSRTLRTGVRGARFDICNASTGGDLVVRSGSTALGRTTIDELQTVGLLLFPYPIGSSDEPDPPTPTITEAVAQGQGLVVALAGPDATPPADRVGYWTDGTRTATVALTPAGRRIFLELGPGDDVRTNVLAYVGQLFLM